MADDSLEQTPGRALTDSLRSDLLPDFLSDPALRVLRIGTSPMIASIDDLWPEERLCVETSIVSRQIEFASGRMLARKLLQDLGHPEQAIPRDDDRVPIWPAGVMGSISHTDGACLVAVSESRRLAGVGVDVEVDEPRSRRFLERISTQSERCRIDAESPDPLAHATRLFSIKEAVYKACYPRLREHWGFRDVEVEFESATGRFRAHVPESATGIVAGSLRERDGRVWTVACWTSMER